MKKEKILVTGDTPEYSPDMLADSRMDEEPEASEDEIVLTFGGDADLGGRENYWGNPDYMMALRAEQGTAYPFSGAAFTAMVPRAGSSMQAVRAELMN